MGCSDVSISHQFLRLMSDRDIHSTPWQQMRIWHPFEHIIDHKRRLDVHIMEAAVKRQP